MPRDFHISELTRPAALQGLPRGRTHAPAPSGIGWCRAIETPHQPVRPERLYSRRAATRCLPDQDDILGWTVLTLTAGPALLVGAVAALCLIG